MIETAIDGRVRTVTLDRPAARNALTSAGLDALEGAGPAFCAGADLGEVAALDGACAKEFARRGQRVARTLEEHDAVTVAAIDGAARGGGLELALACDVRVATPSATFAEPGVSLGLFGTWGGTVRLPRVLCEGGGLEFALSGRVVNADEALRLGLVSRIEEDPRAVAAEIAANPPDALVAIKRRLPDDATPETKEQREAEAFAELVDAHAEELAARRE